MNDLLAAIYERPDDLAARSVYADYLQDRGDPRGELIALQLAGVFPERQAALLRAHEADWLAGTGMIQARWRDGFVDACTCTADADPADPRWRLVRELVGTTALSDAHERPLLRVLTVADARALAALTRALPVEHLTWDGEGARDVDFRRVRCLPALRHLALRWRDAYLPRDFFPVLSPMLNGAFPQLASLHVVGDPWLLPSWTDVAPAVLAVEERGAYPWTVRLTRAGKRFHVALFAPPAHPPAPWLQSQHRPYCDALIAGVGGIPRTALASLGVHAPADALEAIRALLGARLAQIHPGIAWTTMPA